MECWCKWSASGLCCGDLSLGRELTHALQGWLTAELLQSHFWCMAGHSWSLYLTGASVLQLWCRTVLRSLWCRTQSPAWCFVGSEQDVLVFLVKNINQFCETSQLLLFLTSSVCLYVLSSQVGRKCLLGVICFGRLFLQKQLVPIFHLFYQLNIHG